MKYLFIALCAYLMGCSNMAFWLSKINGVDFRKGGSGNLGASNAAVLLGWGAGILVGAHDIGKALAAVLLAKLFCPELEYAGVVAGVAAVLGHVFPFYLRFRGGKGLASFLGMTLALNWKLALGMMLLLAIVTLLTDYIVLGTVSVTIATPVGMWFLTHSLVVILILCIASAVILAKHHENYIRIWNRTEIGLRSTAKGENRVK